MLYYKIGAKYYATNLHVSSQLFKQVDFYKISKETGLFNAIKDFCYFFDKCISISVSLNYM